MYVLQANLITMPIIKMFNPTKIVKQSFQSFKSKSQIRGRPEQEIPANPKKKRFMIGPAKNRSGDCGLGRNDGYGCCSYPAQVQVVAGT